MCLQAGHGVQQIVSQTRRNTDLIYVLTSQSACNIFIDVDCSGLKHDTVPAASLVSLVQNLMAGNLTTGRVQCCVMSRFLLNLSLNLRDNFPLTVKSLQSH